MTARCDSVFRSSYGSTADGVQCTRPDGHRNDHQHWTARQWVDWDGRGGSKVTPNTHPDDVYHCTRCGMADCWKSYFPDSLVKAVDPAMCFSCNHWAAQAREPGGLRINGSHYRIPDERGPRGGFGGAEHVIATFDGRTITTRNLWTQGEIPEYWREELPDNASFVRRGAERLAYTGDGAS